MRRRAFDRVCDAAAPERVEVARAVERKLGAHFEPVGLDGVEGPCASIEARENPEVVLKPRERVEVEHLGREALVLNADVGKRRRRNRAGNIRLSELPFVENGREAVQPLDVLDEELVVYAPELLEAVGTLLALDAKEFLAQALRCGGEGRDALRRERVLRYAHLLSGGDDGLEHGVLSERAIGGEHEER